jgi:hypothetical protein
MDVTDEWRSMASAPRNGTMILVAISSSEQGPAEVDVVRWGRPLGKAESAWIATDSDRDASVIYAEGELTAWMPLPEVVPRLRRRHRGEPNEGEGSGI